MREHVSTRRAGIAALTTTLLLSVPLLLPTTSRAQVSTAANVPFSSLKAADYVAVTYIPPYPEDAEGIGEPNDLGKSVVRHAASFEINFASNFPQAAREAFRYATDVWGRYLTSPEPIVVQAEWTALEEGTLGSAGPLLVGNFAGAEYNNVWYPAALANSLRRSDVSAAQPDIFANFNSEFEAWYFGVDGQVPSNRYDFVTVVLHELAHGLGFSGSFNVDDGDPANGDECPDAGAGWGCWGLRAERGGDVFPLVFDLFTEDDRDVALLVESAYPNPSTALARVLSETVFFDGDFSRTINENVPVDLYAPMTFDLGSSFSHLDESAFPTPPGGPADPDALMTPFLARGEAIHTPGRVTCAMFEDFGWESGAGCEALLVSSSEPDSGTPSLASDRITWFYPNPAASEARAQIEATAPQIVTVEVYDVAGRRVYDGRHSIASGAAVELRLETGTWPSGVYFVRLIGDTFEGTGSLVVARP